MVTIQVERWAQFFPDAKQVFPAHWRELALYQNEIPIDIDEAKYTQLDAVDILLILTARKGGRLIGYYLWFLMPHLHYRSTGPMGLTDMYFVLPEYRRGIGVRLFKASETELKKRGVVKAITSCKLHEDHSNLFKALGWELTDLTWCKLLKGDK